MKMAKDRTVLCAGCMDKFPTQQTIIYRKKRCCTNDICYKVIDQKVAAANYKRQLKKIAKGKFRNGVPIPLKNIIHERDKNTCQECLNTLEQSRMQVHHIKPVSMGGNDDLENLILLCKECHVNIHKEGCENYYGKYQSYTRNLAKVCQ